MSSLRIQVITSALSMGVIRKDRVKKVGKFTEQHVFLVKRKTIFKEFQSTIYIQARCW